MRSQCSISSLKKLLSAENPAGSVFKAETAFQESVFLVGLMASASVKSLPALVETDLIPHGLDAAEVGV